MSAGHHHRDPGSWRDDAACKGMDPELFHPYRGAVRQHRRAVAVCAECPVRAECLEFAVANRLTEGIWGGLGGRERRRLYGYRVKRCARCGQEFTLPPSANGLTIYCSHTCQVAGYAARHGRYRERRAS